MMMLLVLIPALLGVAVVGLLVVASMKPDRFRVERSIETAATAETVFALINELPRWEQWSPWEKLDPSMRKSFFGPSSGVGAGYSWEGDGRVGKGSMEITESQPHSLVRTKLHFIKPFEAHNTCDFVVEPTGHGTRVRWIMEGPQPFTSKVFATIVDMDKMLGKDFDKGLQALKRVAEA